ncbi:hypothetical protein B5C06_10285 [Staphylococcus delphini]|nr:hypothetical protein B5C06_10285 [Staphylococcus delphini]
MSKGVYEMITVGINACITNDVMSNNIIKVDGGGVCLFKDDIIISAITEERITKKKYQGGFKESIKYVLDASNLSFKDVDTYAFSFYGVANPVPQNLKDYLIKELDIQNHQELRILESHHLSHAYSAYFSSQFDKSLIIVNDNEGSVLGEKKSNTMLENSCERTSYYLAENNSIKLIDRDFAYPYALAFGKLYNKCTKYLGLGNYHNAGKTMGLASFSTGKFNNLNDAYIFDKDGSLNCIIDDTGNSERDIKRLFNQLGVNIPDARKADEPIKQIHAEIAGYIQGQLEKWINYKASLLSRKYGVENICLGGGVALNCLVNTSLLKNRDIKKVYVPAAPQDQGLCIGNAIWNIINKKQNKIEKVEFDIPLFLGKKYKVDEKTIENYLKKFDNLKYRKLDDKVKTCCDLLSNSNIVAWFQNESEFGPRALGNRSILASPNDKFMLNRLNIHVKKRETFRPFAPSVIQEKVEEYFQEKDIDSPSMMFTANVKEEFKDLLASVVHIDGTARLQTVSHKDNPLYYNLIKNYGEKYGVYALLDTSFNLNGMPIVETPEDAINCYYSSEIDYLILEDFLIYK